MKLFKQMSIRFRNHICCVIFTCGDYLYYLLIWGQNAILAVDNTTPQSHQCAKIIILQFSLQSPTPRHVVGFSKKFMWLLCYVYADIPMILLIPLVQGYKSWVVVASFEQRVHVKATSSTFAIPQQEKPTQISSSMILSFDLYIC